MMNVRDIVVFKEILNKEYFHFKKYWTLSKYLFVHKEYNRNNKYKFMFDQFVKIFRQTFNKQEVCTECFYYYKRKEMVYTDQPYIDAGLKSEFWWYCSDECIDYRLNLNQHFKN